VTERRAQAAASLRSGGLFDIAQRALCDQLTAMNACARSEIDDVIGPAHRLLVVLDDD
jgi:hypothetical protein